MVSDAKVCTESTESISYNVQLVSELLDHIVDAGHVLQHTHALCVRVIPQGEWTLDCLCKFTVKNKMKDTYGQSKVTMIWHSKITSHVFKNRFTAF